MAEPIVIRQVGGAGGGSAAGLLLLFVAIVGLMALFTGNLERWIQAVAGPAGGPEGLVRQSGGTIVSPSYGGGRVAAGEWGQPVPGGAG